MNMLQWQAYPQKSSTITHKHTTNTHITYPAPNSAVSSAGAGVSADAAAAAGPVGKDLDVLLGAASSVTIFAIST